MIRIIVYALVFYIAPASAQKNTPEIEAQFRSLKWIEGTWERTNVKPGMTANERWYISAPYELKGFGVTMKGQDTVFLEKIQIIVKEDNIYYVADVKENKEPIYFKLTTLTPSGFVCENPIHDFPKKIQYEQRDSGLTVTISSGNRSQNYLFVRRER
jgi:hypothetical protein